MSFFENTRKPVGFSGKIMVAMMNFGHSAMAAWGLHFLQPAPDAMVLDCGCGGGANIKTLLKLCPKGKVKGIDYSAVSVEKARKVNAGAIAACSMVQPVGDPVLKWKAIVSFTSEVSWLISFAIKFASAAKFVLNFMIVILFFLKNTYEKAYSFHCHCTNFYFLPR